ncbi:uncharacterized protein K452DRAFT_306633 [Aplosporella prunicola CBS 121167]|uniref:Uncharacterized protein n=1 Tax=Aplosporella prunicola CBS 121167 TaxID=1176127 RepID=A0A6A6BK23_9PEZI|nr:uncharacterized protein K452DRAFT_306633 [Aplosporella prunicola CBS 121167]KAF2143988.1 hypothetical protein K452DRAFT_306633 [Aplosporella prunicola CBS 121167]
MRWKGQRCVVEEQSNLLDALALYAFVHFVRPLFLELSLLAISLPGLVLLCLILTGFALVGFALPPDFEPLARLLGHGSEPSPRDHVITFELSSVNQTYILASLCDERLHLQLQAITILPAHVYSASSSLCSGANNHTGESPCLAPSSTTLRSRAVTTPAGFGALGRKIETITTPSVSDRDSKRFSGEVKPSKLSRPDTLKKTKMGFTNFVSGLRKVKATKELETNKNKWQQFNAMSDTQHRVQVDFEDHIGNKRHTITDCFSFSTSWYAGSSTNRFIFSS